VPFLAKDSPLALLSGTGFASSRVSAHGAHPAPREQRHEEKQMNYQQYMENMNARFENLATALDQFNTLLNQYITSHKPTGGYELAPVKVESQTLDER
jgi:hypothetical protein